MLPAFVGFKKREYSMPSNCSTSAEFNNAHGLISIDFQFNEFNCANFYRKNLLLLPNMTGVDRFVAYAILYAIVDPYHRKCMGLFLWWKCFNSGKQALAKPCFIENE